MQCTEHHDHKTCALQPGAKCSHMQHAEMNHSLTCIYGAGVLHGCCICAAHLPPAVRVLMSVLWGVGCASCHHMPAWPVRSASQVIRGIINHLQCHVVLDGVGQAADGCWGRQYPLQLGECAQHGTGPVVDCCICGLVLGTAVLNCKNE